VARCVGDPWRADLDRPGADADLALAGVAISVTTEVVVDPIVAAPAEVGVDLTVEGSLKHPPGALAGEVLERLTDHHPIAPDNRRRRLLLGVIGDWVGR